MPPRTLLALCALASIPFVACGGSGADDAPAATLGSAPTTEAETTTTTEPLTVEEEVEAAYLRSWEVFAKAALELDPSGLEDAYTGPALEVVEREIENLAAEGTPVRYEVEHDYTIVVDTQSGIAQVDDTYVNHSVLLDPETGAPSEADPNEVLTEKYLLQEVDGMWKVFDFSRE